MAGGTHSQLSRSYVQCVMVINSFFLSKQEKICGFADFLAGRREQGLCSIRSAVGALYSVRRLRREERMATPAVARGLVGGETSLRDQAKVVTAPCLAAGA